MTVWKVAPACLALLRQANLLAPDRDRRSDGTIGDAAHSSRLSDHNPAPDGYVYAVDLTDDDARGIDCREIARQIVERRDRRVKYLISEGRMVSSYAVGPYPPWTWRPYNGINGHFRHLHVSVLRSWRNDTAPWWTPPDAGPTPPVTPTNTEDGYTMPPTVRLGATGKTVRKVQALLVAHGHVVDIDGDFGPGTEAAVKRHQAAHKLTADGVVGPNTYRSLIET